tara:strand:- start:544 stop:954 length:411 start_codon:yes stop_codon:yes gene_type:complete
MLNFSKRLFSNKSYPITITNNAWTKLEQIFNANKNKGFMFSAEGGGCNGFNYKLNSIEDKTYNKLIESKLPPTILTNNNISVIIDPMSEMYLIGTKIDYIFEDFNKGIFENKFVFTPDKEIASSCGCGVSFAPRNI